MLKVVHRICYLIEKMEDFGIKFPQESDIIEKMSVYDLQHFLIPKEITVANSRKGNLVMLAKC